MEKHLIGLVALELGNALSETRFGSIADIGIDRFVITFDGVTQKRILVSVESREPRIYLVKRSSRDLRRTSIHPSRFSVAVAGALAGMRFRSYLAPADQGLIELEMGDNDRDVSYSLVFQITRSPNIFLIDSQRRIAAVARHSDKAGQSIGSIYSTPLHERKEKTLRGFTPPIVGSSVSEALDKYFSLLDDNAEFESLARSARSRNRQDLAKARKLINNLENDLLMHGDPEKWKRYGDLLLASQRTAKREGSTVRLVDIFDDEQRMIEIEAAEDDSFAKAAQRYFRRYSKARNARVKIKEHIAKARDEVIRLTNIGAAIENAVEQRELETLKEFAGLKGEQTVQASKRTDVKALSGIRSYVSSDGFDILVGKKSTDNDHLTFRIAGSRDTWLHAADYPGSHVVIRNADRREVPQRTLVEAAQLAAFFSQGKKQTKAAVNYTLKKFVSKPRGSVSGIVRLASFKTILVEPVFPGVAIKK